VLVSEAPQTAKDQRTSVFPRLSLGNRAQAAEFYEAAFGAPVLFRHDDPEGADSLSVGQSDFWLADESPEHFNFSPETLGGGISRMVVTTEDPDAFCEQAVRAGRFFSPSAIGPTVGAWGES
jgi:PhnB protein